jgi:acyl-CoA reductase-like NAD-dependent aldehyde dehydrogenase
LNQQDNATHASPDRVQSAIDAAREAVERTRELIERARAAIRGSEHAVAEAESVAVTMNEMRGGKPARPAGSELCNAG